MRQKKLSYIEDLAQELVEGTFGRLFGGRLEPLDVANRLVKVIEDNTDDGQISRHYRVALSPDDYQFLTNKNPGLADNLGTAAQQLGGRAGVNGSGKPHVQLVADQNLKRRQIRITVHPERISQDLHQATQSYSATNNHDHNLGELKELDAFLIIQGRRHIALSRPISTIGRRTENDIVLRSTHRQSPTCHHTLALW